MKAKLSITSVFSLFALLLFVQTPVHATVFDNVAEAADYTLVYDLSIPNAAGWNTNAIPYSVDNSATVGSYNRVAYYLELDTGSGLEWVYASMDPFTNDAGMLGVPSRGPNGSFTSAAGSFQQSVTNMNVFASGGAGVTTGTSINTGNIEFWSTNYGAANAANVPGASSSTFDFGDSKSGTNHYGSMQIHNNGAGETLLAYSRWGSGNGELGIGNQPTGNPDWTFAQNAGSYVVKNMQILVREGALAPLPSAPANIVANAAEAAGYGLVYQLPINDTTFNPAQYIVNNSGQVADGSFDRVGYYVELESAAFGTQFVWVSMDAFNTDAGLLGVPYTPMAIQQMIVDNMNVVSNVGGVTNGEGLMGNIEFWNTNYGPNQTPLIPGGADVFDFDDTRSGGGAYGSMQIHNFVDGHTIFAYNRWNDGNVSDLGLGNQPTGNPDWTFAAAQQPIGANDYTVKNLYVLVRPIATVPEPASAMLSIIGMGVLALKRRRSES